MGYIMEHVVAVQVGYTCGSGERHAKLLLQGELALLPPQQLQHVALWQPLRMHEA